MSDYSKTYRRVPYFGVGFEESADAFGARDAMALLATAVQATQDRDMRHDRDVLDALTYLTEQAGGRLAPATAFRIAMDEAHPVTRRRAMADAYRALCRITPSHIEAG